MSTAPAADDFRLSWITSRLLVHRQGMQAWVDWCLELPELVQSSSRARTLWLGALPRKAVAS
jgi:hypothetical protein